MSRMARFPYLTAMLACVAVASWLSCSGNQPQLVLGPMTFSNDPPTLEIIAPANSISINQGERFVIDWTDADSDSAALISFTLINTETGSEILLVSNIQENDTAAADNFIVATSLIPLGTYNLRGVISDGINEPLSVFAFVESSNTRVLITIGEPGTNPLNIPPQVAVTAPTFNQGVAQDDTLTIKVQPREGAIGTDVPYDADSDTTLFILLDLDDDPENDDPQSPDPAKIIVLRETDLTSGSSEEQVFNITIDLAQIPPRPGGLSYFIRATIIDESNPPVHDYAEGTINILKSATGTIDLLRVGTELSGARFQGFNPGAHLGSKMISANDFDGDGVDDFLLVAEKGNPRGLGNIGEAYLIYGLDGARFGGSTNINTVSAGISGAVFEAPPNRLAHLHPASEFDPRGLTGASILPDVSGDGRPELLFGVSMADGIWTQRDDDPGDEAAVQSVEITFQEGIGARTINNVPDENFTNDDYEGVFDTYIDAAAPNTKFSTSQSLLLSGDDTLIDQWVIVGFRDVFSQLVFQDRNELTVTSATLEVGPFFAGAGTLLIASQVINPTVDDNSVYADFAGGDEPGPEDTVDFDADLDVSIDPVSGFIEIDVTETITKLVDGELETADPVWILRPSGESSGFSATLFSSESTNEDLRPRLKIQTDEPLPDDSSNYNCYSDGGPNNRSDPTPAARENPQHDTLFESLGVVALFNSENRDNNDIRAARGDRLDRAAVPIELIGMGDPPFPLPARGGRFSTALNYTEKRQFVSIPAGASDPAAAGRTRGARIQGGWWDFYDNSAATIGRAAPRGDYFGETVAWMPDLTNDGQPEIIISAPRNEVAVDILRRSTNEVDRRILNSSRFSASILILPGSDFSRNVPLSSGGARMIPWQNAPALGSCSSGIGRGGTLSRSLTFAIFAEDINDFLGGAGYAGDANLDGVPDIVCGAPRNDHPSGIIDSGAMYLIYGRPAPGNIELTLLGDPATRPPTLRIRGETAGDRIGTVQNSGQDINGDRVDDVFFSSPSADFGGVSQAICGDVDGNGILDGNDLDVSSFNGCRSNFGEEVFLDDVCKPYDYDNDRDIDGDDRAVFDCLVGGFSGCCPVDNGYVGVVFGNIQLDGDRDISQLATSDLPGLIFFGSEAGDRAGADVVSAGDFNRDGFGDLLIAAPGKRFVDDRGRDRMGVAYLIFGGTHLNGNHTFSLDQVGSAALPGLVIWSPFFAGRPNEAPIDHVGLLGDINGDGFDDIGLGLTRADFIDSAFPQDPNDSGTNPNIGRRPDDGNVYIIYGNNTGSNR